MVIRLKIWDNEYVHFKIWKSKGRAGLVEIEQTGEFINSKSQWYW